MYFSKSFIPILKNNPPEAKIKSHQLMLRVGMIKQKVTCYHRKVIMNKQNVEMNKQKVIMNIAESENECE